MYVRRPQRKAQSVDTTAANPAIISLHGRSGQASSAISKRGPPREISSFLAQSHPARHQVAPAPGPPPPGPSRRPPHQLLPSPRLPAPRPPAPASASSHQRLRSPAPPPPASASDHKNLPLPASNSRRGPAHPIPTTFPSCASRLISRQRRACSTRSPAPPASAYSSCCGLPPPASRASAPARTSGACCCGQGAPSIASRPGKKKLLHT